MIKRKTVETIKEYDENGKLTRETITETTEDDNNTYYPYQPVYPTTPFSPSTTWGTTCNINAENGASVVDQIKDLAKRVSDVDMQG